MATAAAPTMAPSLLGNNPGRLINEDFNRSSGLIAAAAIFSVLGMILVWAIFYVYWYMPWHGKQLNDCCGRELDNSCSQDCVLKCKEDCEACPEECYKVCPSCKNPEALSIREKPDWNQAHLEGRLHTIPALGAYAGSVQQPPTTEQPEESNTYNSGFVAPPAGNYGVSPLGTNAPVYNPVGGPTIGGPTMGGPTMGTSPLGAGAVPTYNAPTVFAPPGPTLPTY